MYFIDYFSVFMNSFKKADANNIGNLKKMEEHFNKMLIDSYSKFEEVEEKIMSLMNQKEKILLNMSYEIENNTISITAIEEWIKIDQNRGASFKLLEENIKRKL